MITEPKLVARNALVLRAQAQIEALRAAEKAFAERVSRDLLTYPGYYAAAVERNGGLLRKYESKPHWLWAATRWAAIFESGGLKQVLAMFADWETNQELLSASPFCVMRPPLLENHYYSSHAAA
jgi:hypothetical protein